MLKEQKDNLKSAYRLHEKDTGSPEIQVAFLTERINQLTQHLQTHQKDNSSRRGLLKMVAQRRRLLEYLLSNDQDRYKSLIQRLNLRK